MNFLLEKGNFHCYVRLPECRKYHLLLAESQFNLDLDVPEIKTTFHTNHAWGCCVIFLDFFSRSPSTHFGSRNNQKAIRRSIPSDHMMPELSRGHPPSELHLTNLPLFHCIQNCRNSTIKTTIRKSAAINMALCWYNIEYTLIYGTTPSSLRIF